MASTSRKGSATQNCPRWSRQAVEAIHDGHNTYTRLDGIAPLRQAIATKLTAHNNIYADPLRDPRHRRASGALDAACLALLNPGDEAILFEPFYGYHINTLLFRPR